MAAHPVKERRNKIMCGIVGYVGAKECTAILVNSLTKLEYRGYDSAGIAVFEGDRIKNRQGKGQAQGRAYQKARKRASFHSYGRYRSYTLGNARRAERH